MNRFRRTKRINIRRGNKGEGDPAMIFVWIAIVFSLGAVVALATTSAMLKRNTVHITEQDLVRYCLDRRREHADAEAIRYYCLTLGGDYYAAQGVKPNYDKFPSDKMFQGK